MEKDPVCQMFVDENKAAAASAYNGKTYYFCTEGCKAVFDKAPRAFVDSTYYDRPGAGYDNEQQAIVEAYNELRRSCRCH